jgi:hypothetical protein
MSVDLKESCVKEGTYVQHRTRSEWGVGCVLHRQGDRAHVQFKHGLVVLDLRVATPLFEQVYKPDPAIVAELNAPAPPARARRASRAKTRA